MKLPFFKQFEYKDILFPISIVVFLASLVITAAFLVDREIKKAADERTVSRISEEAQNITINTEQALQRYESVLISARGLFDASSSVERVEWRDYVNSLKLEENYPSIAALEFVQRVSLAEKDDYVRSVRNDTSLISTGYSDFEIRPETKNEELFVVHYLEPLEGNEESFGFDLFSNAARRKAIEIARDTDLVTITEPLILAQEKENEKAFLMILPVYNENHINISTLEERRKNILGLVIAVIRAEDFFDEITLRSIQTHTDSLRVVDVTEKNIELLRFYNKGFLEKEEAERISIAQTSRVNFGGRSWVIELRSDDFEELIGVAKYAFLIVLVGGLMVTVSIGFALYNSLNLKVEAEKIAQELTEDLQKFEMAVEAASDHIVITNSEGVIIYANKAAEIITGYSKEEMLNTKAGKLWGGLMEKSFYKKMWDTIKVQKKTFEGEIKNRRKSGVVYEALSTISPVLDKNKEVRFFVAIERDITREKQIDRMKDEFISIASHELRTPMTAIKGFLSMILEGDYGKVNETVKNTLTDVMGSTDRLIHLVNDMLNVSRIESGRLKYVLSEFDIKEVVDSTISSLQPIAKEKKLSLTGNVSSSKVFGDKSKATEILNNLIGNSLKFTNKGEVKLTSEKKEDFLVLLVEDTGVGISAENKEKLFGKFSQVEDHSRGHAEGTGLGLYISKNIAKKFGGDVFLVKSEEGKGSTFAFSLPLAGSEVAKKSAKIIEDEAKTVPNQKEMN